MLLPTFWHIQINLIFPNGNDILKTNLSAVDFILQKLTAEFGFRGNFFSLKDRIHPKVHKRQHQNLVQNNMAAKKSLFVNGVKNGSEAMNKFL